MAGLLVLLTRPRVARGMLNLLPLHGRWGSVRTGTLAILDHARQLLAPRRLLTGLGLGLLAWGAEAWGFYCLLHWLGIDIAPLHAMGIYAISMLAGALSFLPGGHLALMAR